MYVVVEGQLGKTKDGKSEFRECDYKCSLGTVSKLADISVDS